MRAFPLVVVAVCASLLAPASGATRNSFGTLNLPPAAVVRAITATFNVQPSNDSTPIPCNGINTATTVMFSLLEERSSRDEEHGWNVHFATNCTDPNSIPRPSTGTFYTQYQPPLWEEVSAGSYAATFPGSGEWYDGSWTGQATVVLCPPGGEAMNREFKVLSKAMPDFGSEYRFYTFYLWDASFC